MTESSGPSTPATRAAFVAGNAAAGDAPRPVEKDLACRKCGYNLRGLMTDGRCPECGTAVGLSVMGDLLRFSDPNWVDTLGRGVKLIIAGVAVLILGGVLSVAAAMVLGPAPLVVVVLGGWILVLMGLPPTIKNRWEDLAVE